MSEQTRVSVVIPVRNGAATLAEALASVLAEPETGEILVVDDGSTDGTADVARAIEDSRIRILDGPCEGISAAFNTGLRAARLDYIARCDADDRFVAGRLGAQQAWLDTHPDFAAISGAYATMTARGRKLVMLADTEPARDVTELLCEGRPITHFCTWLTRRKALLAIGGARRWFVTGEDLDMQFRLALEGRVWHDPRPAYFYRLHETSITHSQAEERRVFFETQARRFAMQRLRGASDDLSKGQPPVFVAGASAGQVPTRASVQAAGQLEGMAWRRRETGHRIAALGLMTRSLSLDPLSARRWKSFTSLALKMLK